MHRHPDKTRLLLTGIIASAAAILLPGCGNPLYLASRLPGLQQVSDSMNERAFVDWMESDPAPQVRARVAKGDYNLLGLAIYDKKDYWIPGVTARGKTGERSGHHATWHGMGGGREKYIPLAESYMTRFNAMMLEQRKGVPLDLYGRGPQHKDYAGPVKKTR